MPRVSVVLRTKDRPWFLARALRDIGAQTFRDFEVVVVDDGTDSAMTARVVDEAGLAAVRVVEPERPGRCAAANAGVAAAGGDLLVLHDDDDLWEREFLARCVAWLDAHPEDIGVMTRTTIRYEAWQDGAWRQVGTAPFWADMQRISLTEMLQVNRAVPISFLYRRAAHDAVGGYDETLDAVEDWEFTLRLLVHHTIGFIPEPLAIWAQRPSAGAADANSMFALETEHRRDDAVVRDRALQEWIERNGVGLPLMIAGEFAELRRELFARLTVELDRRHPFSALARRVVLAARRRRGTGR
ncbi:glycosyltransferase involved in cell wall biosynthesis [Microbacterium sp. SORGH_AS428]|uniref:glycosyltransferase family 2 protein n=1 Tax=Microbacterium sp. SORGH_AS_0428 TaxID=3041788 RepID=UPI0028599894|nr:glycosyltransferase [Microbacterium sp. SORGH_AS_0428]MDR6199091.1 glycosyltransferase involved in cell wall biosynthesis [Microbacterium sp. SORGH_AS_0428]